MKTGFLNPFLLLGLASLALAQAPHDTAVARELQSYYAKGKQPGWAAAVKQLSAEGQDQRARAAHYLVALLDQAQKDELSGKAPWRATPFWGSSGENPARNLRERIAGALTTAPPSAATLAVVRWYLDHEKVGRLQETAVKALGKVDGKEADASRLSLLQPGHENSAVVLGALRQIGQRKATIPEATLKALCQHYRPSLRAEARKLNMDRGGADPGPFDPVKAMQAPALTRLMADVGALFDQTAPPDAAFVVVTTVWTDDKETDTSTTLGWLVKKGDSWVVLTPFGHRERFQKEVTTKNRGGGQSTLKSRWN